MILVSYVQGLSSGPYNKDLLVFYSFSDFFQENITKRDHFYGQNPLMRNPSRPLLRRVLLIFLQPATIYYIL